MEIITLTLSPAFDIHCRASAFQPYHENIVEVTARDAGGKGVNISRALARFGRSNTAVLALGKENGDEFCRMLDGELDALTKIWCDGRIRENITLHEDGRGETRISFGGFPIDGAALRRVRDALSSCGDGSIVTLTGSIPSGVPMEDVLALLGECKARGAKIVIDSRSVSLSELLSFSPWLIKPNQDEISAYTGEKIETAEDAARIAKELCASGIRNVMVSLGSLGAVLASAGNAFYARASHVNAVSTIGAGDSSIAGFLDGYASGAEIHACLARAVAFGSAACLREGTQPPLPSDVARLLSEISVIRL